MEVNKVPWLALLFRLGNDWQNGYPMTRILPSLPRLVAIASTSLTLPLVSDNPRVIGVRGSPEALEGWEPCKGETGVE